MLDLSNINGEPDWKRVYQSGQRRVYLKCTEGKSFVDKDFARRRRAAHRAGLKVGAYHFSHSEHNSPIEEAHFFVRNLGQLAPRGDLRPCLDFEIGTPSAKWAEEFMVSVKRLTGVQPIIYSYADFLVRSNFHKAPTGLWLASYGRNDGAEHPYQVPRPWKRIVAHQYSSNARVAGVPGRVDISHVYNFKALELPPLEV